MSKYDKLWEYVKNCDKERIRLTFAEIEAAAGVPLDHSFLSFKKELVQYGYSVKKIPMKEKNVLFEKIKKEH